VAVAEGGNQMIVGVGVVVAVGIGVGVGSNSRGIHAIRKRSQQRGNNVRKIFIKE
jgi:hypothetical protein